MRLAREVNYPFASSAEFKNEWSHTSTPPCFHVVDGENFSLYLIVTDVRTLNIFISMFVHTSLGVRFEGYVIMVVHDVAYAVVGGHQCFGETHYFRLQDVQGTAVCSSFRGSFWLRVQGRAITRVLKYLCT